MKSHMLTLCQGSFRSNSLDIPVGMLSTRENWRECLRDSWRRMLLLAKAVLEAPGCATARGETWEGRGGKSQLQRLSLSKIKPQTTSLSCCVCVAERPGVGPRGGCGVSSACFAEWAADREPSEAGKIGRRVVQSGNPVLCCGRQVTLVLG